MPSNFYFSDFNKTCQARILDSDKQRLFCVIVSCYYTIPTLFHSLIEFQVVPIQLHHHHHYRYQHSHVKDSMVQSKHQGFDLVLEDRKQTHRVTGLGRGVPLILKPAAAVRVSRFPCPSCECPNPKSYIPKSVADSSNTKDHGTNSR